MNYKNYLILLVLSSATVAEASSLICPATVKAGSQLTVTVNITNEDCSNPLTIDRTVVSLIGNSGSGTIGLQGPFVTPFANNFSTLIGHAKCTTVPYTAGHPEWGTYTKVIPTTHSFANIVVIGKVPSGMGGTLALANAGVLDTNNKLIIAGQCYISVTK